MLDLLGLGARAGSLIFGTDAVRASVREGKIHRVIVAADAAEGQQRKLLPLLAARKIPHHIEFTRGELGNALGRAPLSAVGVADARLADRAGELLSALAPSQDSGGR